MAWNRARVGAVAACLALGAAGAFAAGGDLVRPGSQKGEIVIANCQTAADGAWIASMADYFREETRCRIMVKDGCTFGMAQAVPAGELRLYVIDDAAESAIVVAPESRWTMVNAADLKGADRKAFEDRFRKRLSRGFAHLCGGASSRFRKNVLGGVATPEAMDRIESWRLPLDSVQLMRPFLERFGIRPGIPVTYANACREGWAPAPTNDIQRALWEKARAAKAAKE